MKRMPHPSRDEKTSWERGRELLWDLVDDEDLPAR